jgi:uncharacterized membrane protein/thiol-disulfide isomerase/thioredoxin
VKRYQIIIPILLLVSLFVVPSPNAQAQSPQPIVHAVLFYSPTCPHCQHVINDTLPPLMQKYGNQLEITGVDVTQPQGQTLFLAALDKFKLLDGGVPFLIIGDKYLMGSADIPEQLPGLIDTYLTQGGVDFPDIPGLRDAISQSPETAVAPTQSATLQTNPVPVTATNVRNPNWTDNFARDPGGNTLAVLVLAGMLGAVGWAVFLFQKTKGISFKDNWTWIIPVLCIVGLGIAGYLAYVETAQVTAICGPMGDCNTVQQSEYARLFGFLPVGILGLVGYVIILIAWVIARYAQQGRRIDLALLSLFAITVFGTLFSIYLTFLEPFFIGATCIWCLTSSVLMTILMMLTVKPAKLAFSRLAHPRFSRHQHIQIGTKDD